MPEGVTPAGGSSLVEPAFEGRCHWSGKRAECPQGVRHRPQLPGGKDAWDRSLDEVGAGLAYRPLEFGGEALCGLDPDRRDAEALRDLHEVELRMAEVELGPRLLSAGPGADAL